MLYADGELEADRVAEVEAWLAADASARDKLDGLCMVSRVVREEALDRASGADDLTERIMAAVERDNPAPAPIARPPAPRVPSPAANDNGRRRVLYVAAALVAAAAAALLWVRPPGGVAVAPGPSTSPAAHPASPAGSHGVEADVEHGVEVAAIDFGSTTGAVLYVPNGTSPSDTTTVVWLSDNEPDGEDE
jgi:anti-sigma factor RsiW